MEKGNTAMSVYENRGSARGGGSAIAGFFSAGLFAVAFTFFVVVMISQMSFKTATPLALGSSLSGIIGSLLLWAAYKESKPNFARGALIFCVVFIALAGTCWLGILASNVPAVK
jgi:hypothetical protein